MGQLVDVDTGEVLVESFNIDLLYNIAFRLKEENENLNLWIFGGVNNGEV